MGKENFYDKLLDPSIEVTGLEMDNYIDDEGHSNEKKLKMLLKEVENAISNFKEKFKSSVGTDTGEASDDIYGMYDFLLKCKLVHSDNELYFFIEQCYENENYSQIAHCWHEIALANINDFKDMISARIELLFPEKPTLIRVNESQLLKIYKDLRKGRYIDEGDGAQSFADVLLGNKTGEIHWLKSLTSLHFFIWQILESEDFNTRYAKRICRLNNGKKKYVDSNNRSDNTQPELEKILKSYDIEIKKWDKKRSM